MYKKNKDSCLTAENIDFFISDSENYFSIEAFSSMKVG